MALNFLSYAGRKIVDHIFSTEVVRGNGNILPKVAFFFPITFLELLIQPLEACLQQNLLCKAPELMAQRAVTKGFSVILLRIAFYQESHSNHAWERMWGKGNKTHRGIESKNVPQTEHGKLIVSDEWQNFINCIDLINPKCS